MAEKTDPEWLGQEIVYEKVTCERCEREVYTIWMCSRGQARCMRCCDHNHG